MNFDMFYILWRRLAKRGYGINKYMNMKKAKTAEVLRNLYILQLPDALLKLLSHYF
jgi:hypothetical protein